MTENLNPNEKMDIQSNNELQNAESFNLKQTLQTQQDVIIAQNTLIQALERVIKAHHIKDEAFRMLDDAYRTFDESNRLLDEAYRSREAADRLSDEVFRNTDKAFRPTDEAFRRVDEAFRLLDAAFRRRNEAETRRNDLTDERNTASGNESARSNQEKPITEQIIELSVKVKQSTKLGDDKHSERIVKRIAHALLLIKQHGRMRVSELRKQLATNRSALQRDASMMMSQQCIIGEGGPMKREYIITDAGKMLVEQKTS